VDKSFLELSDLDVHCIRVVAGNIHLMLDVDLLIPVVCYLFSVGCCIVHVALASQFQSNTYKTYGQFLTMSPLFAFIQTSTLHFVIVDNIDMTLDGVPRAVTHGKVSVFQNNVKNVQTHCFCQLHQT
jgi:hypothetical protein